MNKTIRDYQFNSDTDKIGSGGSSTVYKALHKRLNLYRALKIYRISDDKRPDLFAEVGRMIDVTHPNLVRFYDAFEHDDNQIGILEFANKGSLTDFIKTEEYLNLKNKNELIKKLLLDILNGLNFLHQETQMVHRDIKPENILIFEDNKHYTAKIADFQTCKTLNQSNSSVKSSLSLITWLTVAPEQVEPDDFGVNGKVDYNADLWAFGELIYMLFNNGHSHYYKNDEEPQQQKIIAAILKQTPINFNNIPEPFKSVAQKCLVYNASERIKTVQELFNIFNIADKINEELNEIEQLIENKKYIQAVEKCDNVYLNFGEHTHLLEKKEQSIKELENEADILFRYDAFEQSLKVYEYIFTIKQTKLIEKRLEICKEKYVVIYEKNNKSHFPSINEENTQKTNEIKKTESILTETETQPYNLIEQQVQDEKEKIQKQLNGPSKKSTKFKKKHKFITISSFLLLIIFVSTIFISKSIKNEKYKEYIKKGDNAYQNKNYAVAENNYNKALEFKEGDSIANYKKFLVIGDSLFYLTKNYDEALENYNEAIKFQSNNNILLQKIDTTKFKINTNIAKYKSVDNQIFNNLVIVQDSTTLKYGYVNNIGEPVINCTFDTAHRFSEVLDKLAVVSFGERFGMINTKGETITKYEYIKILPFNDTLFWGKRLEYIDYWGYKTIIINKNGIEYNNFPCNNIDFIGEYAIQKGGSYYSVINTKCEKILDNFKKIQWVVEGEILKVQDENNFFGIFEVSNLKNPVIKIEYNSIDVCKLKNDKLVGYKVKKGNKYGFYNKNYELKIDTIYKSIDYQNFNNQFGFIVNIFKNNEYKTGFYNDKFNQIIEYENQSSGIFYGYKNNGLILNMAYTGITKWYNFDTKTHELKKK